MRNDRPPRVADRDPVADPNYSATLAVTIDAWQETVWPWLVQRGSAPRFYSLSGGRRAFELEFLDAVADLIAVLAEQRRRLGLIPTASLQRLDDE